MQIGNANALTFSASVGGRRNRRTIRLLLGLVINIYSLTTLDDLSVMAWRRLRNFVHSDMRRMSSADKTPLLGDLSRME